MNFAKLVGLAIAAAFFAPVAAGAAEQPAAFKVCAVCHKIEPGKNLVGPSLFGVVGRKSAAVEGFKYSASMAKINVVWDEATLAKYLPKPMQMVPGTRMTYDGLKKREDVAQVISYLKTLK